MDHEALRGRPRHEIVIAAAMALMQHGRLGIELAGVETAKFIRTVRPVFRRNGFRFTDDECGAIQHELRRYAAFQARLGRLPVISPGGGNPMGFGMRPQ